VYDEQDGGGGKQGAAAVSAAEAAAGLQRLVCARCTAEAHGPCRRQGREAVDQSGIEPGHVEVDGVR
jgi:hypothetical protein